ncbi:hypothetical protein [Nocardioides caldifontis]|uniref:hypothetical protein n=1 Tax=Nocardioides caldifontis TaxID=2588938 RepID=UPI0011DF66B7|nr:hypothetical protein [Nocardioides caldifontis]
MSVSTIGQRMSAAALRHVLATVLVFLSIFYYFYGPPITDRLARAAHDRCNELTGSSYRNYVLQWRTTTYQSLDVPHWQCHSLSEPGRAWDLGWWVSF